MTLAVEAPPGREAERRYVLGVVLGEWLGLDWRLVPAARSDVRIALDGAPSGPCVLLPDELLGCPPERWLADAALPSTPLARGTVDDPGSTALAAGEELPVLFGSAPLAVHGPDGIRLGVDVFGSAFFMLTRYEELVVAQRDRYGRFPAAASLSGREGFLATPIVDAYVELLWSALERTWPRLERRPRRFAVAVSHDVDDALATLGRGPALVARQFAGDLAVRRDAGLAVQRARALVAARRGDHRRDPHNTFDFLMDASERHELRGAFHFLVNPRVSARDGAWYLLDHPFIGSLIARIAARGHEVGYHAGFATYLDPDATRREFERLRAVAEAQGVRQDLWGGRQHFLRWANPVTWRNWEAAGLGYDSTLAYAEAVGFRSGTCHEHPVFDLEARRPLRLRERPFQVMDNTVFSYMSLAFDEARAAVAGIAAQCRRFGGTLGLLWHNSEYLREARHRRWYEALLGAVTAP